MLKELWFHLGCQSPAFVWAGQGTKDHFQVQRQACHCTVTTTRGCHSLPFVERLNRSSGISCQQVLNFLLIKQRCHKGTGTFLSTSHIILFNPHKSPITLGLITLILISQMRKLKHREFRYLFPGHTVLNSRARIQTQVACLKRQIGEWVFKLL